MRKIRFKKNKISIQNIGKQRFWFGVFSGFFTAISITLLFNQTRKIFRVFSSTSSELQLIRTQELLFFDYFFSTLSSVLGFAITIWVWMNNRTNTRKMDSLYKQMARTNALLIFWLTLYMITRGWLYISVPINSISTMILGYYFFFFQ